MLTGVFKSTKKDGRIYYRSNITYRSKHISLGSFQTEQDAHQAYLEADQMLQNTVVTIHNVPFTDYLLSHEKIVTLLNFRDNRIYIKNPIYMYRS